MSVKTIVSAGRQYRNDKGELIGLTSKDNGKHWRICRRTARLWVGYSKTPWGDKVGVVFEGERAAQAALDTLAIANDWEAAEA